MVTVNNIIQASTYNNGVAINVKYYTFPQYRSMLRKAKLQMLITSNESYIHMQNTLFRFPWQTMEQQLILRESSKSLPFSFSFLNVQLKLMLSTLMYSYIIHRFNKEKKLMPNNLKYLTIAF